MSSSQKSFETSGIPLWPRFNLLESPGLQRAVTETNDSLATKPAYTHECLVALAKPLIYPYLQPVSPGSLVDFDGASYAPTSIGSERTTVTNAEFLDIAHRRIGGMWRIVFAITATPDDGQIDLYPPHIDIDPLEQGNTLFAEGTPSDVCKRLVADLDVMAKLSIDRMRKPDATGAAKHMLKNDVATEAARVCDADIPLRDYLFSMRSQSHYFALKNRRAAIMLDNPEFEKPVGTYGGVQFLDQIVEPKTLQGLPPEDIDAPCIILDSAGRGRFAYPLARLAAVELVGFHSVAAKDK